MRLRSPSSDATAAADAAPAWAAPAALSAGAPHCPQKRLVGWSAAPQFAQERRSGSPQLSQNLFPGALRALQALQLTLADDKELTRRRGKRRGRLACHVTHVEAPAS
jgi:hypothetical protein